MRLHLVRTCDDDSSGNTDRLFALFVLAVVSERWESDEKTQRWGLSGGNPT